MKTLRSRSLAIIIGMLFCWIIPHASFADYETNGICYSLNEQQLTAEVTGLADGYSGDIIIPDRIYSGQVYTVISIGSSAFSGCTSITSVEIPSSVTNIGSSAFSGCSGLTSITVLSGNIEYDSRNGCNAIIETATNTLIVGCKNTVIPNSVTSIGDGAFSGCTSLTSVTIPNSVTSIGSSAFSSCTGLTSVEIPNSVTSIGNSAFYGCTGLTSVEIPNSVTSIGNSAFYDCTGLTLVSIGNGVTYIGFDAFGDCYGLTSVTIPNSVTSIGSSAFSGCTSLTSITVDAGNTKYDSRNDCNAIIETATNTLIIGCKNTVILNSVTNIYDFAFRSCTGLTSVTIPNSVTSIGDCAFYGCTGLTSVTIGNSVTSIGNSAFYGCTGLTSITCKSQTPVSLSSNTVFYNVDRSACTLYVPAGSKTAYQRAAFWSEFTNIVGQEASVLAAGQCGYNLIYTIYDDMSMVITGTGPMWHYSDKVPMSDYLGFINSVTIEEGCTGIGRYAFYDCTGLTSVDIPNSLTSIGEHAFFNCTGLTSVNIPNSVTSIYLGSINSVTIEEVRTGIGESAFENCTALASVDIPNSVTSIGERAFFNCTGLTSVNIPNSVTSISEDAFSCCTALTTISVDAGNSIYDSRNDCNAIIETSTNELILGCKNTVIPNNVTSIGQFAFYDCSGLTSVEIPNSVTSIGTSAFLGCTGLTSVTISNSVSNISLSAFSYCSGLISINVDADNATYDSRENCNAIIETLTSTLIAGCNNTVIPNSVTSIGDLALAGRRLTSIDIPNSVTSIGQYAFENCMGLTSVTIPNSVTSIGQYAFEGCMGLTSVTIPNSVTSIGDYAFEDCFGLNSIIVKGETPASVGSSTFYNVYKSNCTLYVPAGSKTAYENAEGWSEFNNIVEVEFDTDISTLDNTIYVEPTEGRIGGTKDISVKMKNDFDVRGFQFTMELPEGTAVNSWTLNQGRMPAGTTMNKVFATEGIDENKINVVCALNDGEKTFTGNDGLIATVNVTFAEDMEEGSYPIYLTHNSISDATAQTQLVLSDIKSTLVLEDYVLGDTNGDGMVLVGDVISILNYIVGSPSNNFNAKAADVNGDGMILVGDVIAVLNIIVNQ